VPVAKVDSFKNAFTVFKVSDESWTSSLGVVCPNGCTTSPEGDAGSLSGPEPHVHTEFRPDVLARLSM
jgi:hypothetical protein